MNELLLANIQRRDMVQAEITARDAYALAERIGYLYEMVYIRINQAWMHSLDVDLERQHAALQDALRMSRGRPGLGNAELLILINLGVHHFNRGQLQEAMRVNRRAIALAERQGKLQSKAVAMLALGNAMFQSGQREPAVALIEESVRRSSSWARAATRSARWMAWSMFTPRPGATSRRWRRSRSRSS